jgi:hypothetical protein
VTIAVFVLPVLAAIPIGRLVGACIRGTAAGSVRRRTPR